MIPLVSQHDILTFMLCLLHEADAEIVRLKPRAKGAAGELYKTQLKYWQNVARFVSTRIRQGLKSVPNDRYLWAKKGADELLFPATTQDR